MNEFKLSELQKQGTAAFFEIFTKRVKQRNALKERSINFFLKGGSKLWLPEGIQETKTPEKPSPLRDALRAECRSSERHLKVNDCGFGEL